MEAVPTKAQADVTCQAWEQPMQRAPQPQMQMQAAAMPQFSPYGYNGCHPAAAAQFYSTMVQVQQMRQLKMQQMLMGQAFSMQQPQQSYNGLR